MKKTLNFLKTNLNLVVMLLLYVITVIFFARLNTLFGTVTKISLSTIIIYPVLIFGIALALPKIKDALKIKDKTAMLVCYIVLAILIVVSAIFIFANPYNFIAYTFPAAIIPIALYLILKNVVCKCFYKNLGSIVLASILVVSFAFIAITSPATISDSKDLIEKSGYSDVTYVVVMEEDFYTAINADFEKLSYDSYATEMGFYIFNGKRNDKEYAIYVEVTTGKIAIMQDFAEHEKAIWLNTYSPDAE